MTISAIFGGEAWFDFASTRGHGDFVRWSEKLDAEKYEAIVHLAEWGWVNDLPELSSRIKSAMLDVPPSRSLRKTLREFLDNIAKAPPGAVTVVLTSGMTQ